MLLLALIVQAVLLVYHQVTTLFDFFPFNGVRGSSRAERLGEAAVNFVFMGFPLVGLIVRTHGLMQSGVFGNFYILSGEFATWWIPYFFGPSPKWLEIYSRVQRSTIMVLPRRGTNPVPNLEHLILMVLTGSAAVTSLLAFRAVQPEPFTNLPGACLVGALVFGTILYQTTLMGRSKARRAATP
jgi:hypothetical protein